jgi:hypothetical protein
LENLNLNLAGFPPPSKTLIWTRLKFSRPCGTEFGNGVLTLALPPRALLRIYGPSKVVP